MNKEKTKQYYASLGEDDLCMCAYCRHYRRHVRESYSHLAEWMDSHGIDIEKPHETMPLDPYDNRITYIGTQYVVIGTQDDLLDDLPEGIDLHVTTSHPYVESNEPFFVIETDEMDLPWNN